MAIRQIPVSYEHTCDGCGMQVTWGNSSPITTWGRVQLALNTQHTLILDLCPQCFRRVKEDVRLVLKECKKESA